MLKMRILIKDKKVLKRNVMNWMKELKIINSNSKNKKMKINT